MKKLTKEEISFIRGNILDNYFVLYWCFSFISNYQKIKELELIMEYLNKLKQVDKNLDIIYSLRDELKDFDKAKEILNWKEIDHDFYFRHTMELWIRMWFSKNKILQIKRSKNLWNKWDNWYEENLLFVKFENDWEIKNFEKIFEEEKNKKENYEKWFEENKNYFIKIN